MIDNNLYVSFEYHIDISSGAESVTQIIIINEPSLDKHYLRYILLIRMSLFLAKQTSFHEIADTTNYQKADVREFVRRGVGG